MIRVSLPLDEPARVRRLLRLGMAESARDAVLDSVAQRALLLFPGADSAGVTFVGTDRVWFKASAGRFWGKLPRDHSFCTHTVMGRSLLVVEDTWRDPRFTEHPLVTGEPGVRFYVAAPLLDGVGTLCVMGLQPRMMTAPEAAALQTLAQTVDQRLSLHRAVRDLTRQIPLG